MIGKFLFCLSVAASAFGLAANAVTTSQDVDIVVTHNAGSAPSSQTLISGGGSLSNQFAFIAGAGSANAQIGKVVPIIYPASPAFNGSWAIAAGADASKFKIDPATGILSVCNTAPSCTDLGAGTYHVNVQVTQAGVAGSPFTYPVTLTGVDQADTATPVVLVDNVNPTAGSVIHVTVRNAPNTQGKDYLRLLFIYERSAGFVGDDYQYLGVGVHNTTLTFTIPNVPSDNYSYYVADLNLNDGFTHTAASPTIVVQPTVAYKVPGAANTLAAPFTPSQTLTVCPSGCNYPSVSQAIIGLSNSNHGNSADNVLITVGPGTYPDCQHFGNADAFTPPTDDRMWHLPAHLWIKGIGGDLAHFNMGGLRVCGHGVFEWWGNNTDMLVVENVDIGDFPASGNNAGFYVAAGGTLWTRNVYVHDGENGMLTQNKAPNTFLIQNSHFARLGSQGFQHGIYIGEGDDTNTLTVQNSVFEQSLAGHEIKTRAKVSTIFCNMILGSNDPLYGDSEEINMAEGREDHVYNNTIVKGGPGNLQQDQIGFGNDRESPLLANNFLDLHDNYIIYDGTDQHWFAYDYLAMTPSPPYTWSNNKFVGQSNNNNNAIVYLGTVAWNPPPNSTDVTINPNVVYPNRAGAGISQQFPMPPNCTAAIGNVAVP